MYRLVSPLSIPSVDELSELTNEEVYNILQRDHAARRSTPHVTNNTTNTAQSDGTTSQRPPLPMSTSAPAERVRDERPAARFAQTTYTSTNKVEPVSLAGGPTSSHTITAQSVQRNSSASSSTAMTTALSRLMTPLSDAQLLEMERWRWRTLVQTGWFHQHVHHARWDEAWLRRGRLHRRRRLALQATTAVTMSHTRALCIALNIHPSLLETMESPCEARADMAGRRGGAPQVPQAGHGARKPHGRPRRVNASASESENENTRAEDKRRVHYGPTYDDDENDSSGAAVVEDDDDDEDEEEAGYDDYRSFFANERRRGLCDEVEDPAPYLFAWQLPAFIAGDVATTLGQIGSQVQAQYTTFATRPLPTIHLSVTRAGEVYQALSEARANAGPEARVMFHYSAHGMPALQDGQLYFLHAVNSNRGSLATGMPYDTSLREDMNVAADSAMYVRASVSTMLARLGLPLVFVADCVDAGAVLRELLRCYHDRLVTAAAMAAAVKASGNSNNNTKSASTTTPSGGGGAGRHGSRNVSSAELDALTNQNNNASNVTSRGVHVGSGTVTGHTAALNSNSNGGGAMASWTAPPRGALLFIGTADRANEGIHQLASPYRARLPADLLTSCLTTPIRMILLFFMIHHGRHNADLHPLLLHLLPGALQDRKTPLGQLHFFMQRLTENIAWSSLPIELYSLLFREDVHVAPLFRHYLIAEFLIVGKLGGKLVVYPPLPPMHQHPLWANVPCVLEVTLVSLLQAVRPRPAAVLSAMEYREWLDERITRWKYEQQQQQSAQAHWSRQEAGRVSEQTGVAVEAGSPSSSSSSPLSPWTFLSAQAIAGSPALIIAAPTSPLPRITEDHPVQLISFLTEDLRSVEAAIDTLTTQAFCVPSQRGVAGRRGQTTVLTRSRRRPGTEPPRPTSTADLHDEEEQNNCDEQYGENDEDAMGYVESGDYRPFSAYRNSSLQQQPTGNVTHTNSDTTPLTRPGSNGADGAKATRHAAQSAHNNDGDDDTSRPVFPPLTLMPTLLQSLLVVSHREKGTELLCRFIDVGMPAVVQCAKANLYRIVLDHYWTRPDLRFLLPSTLLLFSKSCYVDPALIGSEKQRSIVIRVCTELLQSPVRLSATPRASSAPQPGTPQSMARRQGSGGEQTTNANEATTSNSSRTRMVSGSAASHTAHGTTGIANHTTISKSVVQGAWQSVVLGDYATPAGQRLLACSLLSLLVLHDPAACTQCHELGVLQLCCQLLASSTRASQCSRTSGVGAAWRPQDDNDTSSEETTITRAAANAGQSADTQAELDAAPPRAIATQYHMALLALFVALVHRWRPATSQPAHEDDDNRDDDDDDDEGGEGEGEDDVGLCVLQPLDGQVHTLPATNEHTLQASLQLVGPALERLLYDRASVLRGAAMRALAVTLVMPCASEAMRVSFVSIALRRLYEDGKPPACEANALVLFESTGLAETLVRWLVTRLSRELGSMESLTEFVTSYLARWLRQTRQLRPMTHPYLAVVRDGPGREPHITLAERGSDGQPGWGLAAMSLQQALQDILAPANIKSHVTSTGATDSSAHTSETTTSSTAPALMHTSHSVPHWVSHSATTTTANTSTTTTRASATRRLLQAEAARAAAHIRLGPPTRQPTQVMAYLTVLSNLVRLFIEHSYDCGPYASAKLRGVLNDELSFLFAPWFAQQQEERAGRPSARRDMRRGFTSQTAGHVAFHDLIAHTSNNNSSTFHSATVRAEAALLRPPSSSSSFAAAAAAAAVMAATDDELHRHSAVDVKEVWRELFTQVRQRVGGNYHDLHGRGVGRRCAGQQLERLRPRRPYHRTTAFNWDGVEGQTGMHHAPEPPNTTTTGVTNNNTVSNNAFLHLRHHTRQEGGRGATPWRLPIAPLPTSMNFAHFCPHKARHVQAFVFSALGYLSDLLLVPEDDMDSRHPYHARTTEALHDYLTVLSNGLHSSTALDGLAQPPGLPLSNDEDVSLETQSVSHDDNKEANNSTTDRPQVTSSTSTYRKTRSSAISSTADNSNSADDTICPYVQLCTSREGSQTVPGDVTHFLFHPSQPHAVACTDRGFVRIYEYGVSTHRQRAFLRPSSTYHIADVVARAGPLSYTSLQLRYRYRTRCYAREYAASHSDDDDETSSSCDSRSSASKAEPRGVDEDNEGAQSDQDDDDDAASRQTAVYHSYHSSQRPSLPSQAASEEVQANNDNDDNASEGSARGEAEDNGGREEGRGQKDSRDGRRPGRLSSPHHTRARPAERRTASMPDSRPAFHNGISGMHLIDAAYETILCTIRRTGAVELFTQYTHSGTVRRLSTFETAQLGLCGHQTQDRLSSYQPQSSLLYLSSGETSVAAWDLQTEQLDTLYSAAPASSIVEAASVLQAHPAEPRQCALAAGGVYVFDLRSPQPRLFVSPLAQSTSSSLASSACFSAGAQPRTSSAAATSLHGAASAFASPVCVHVNFSLRYPHALFTGYSGGMVLVWDDRTTRTPLYTYSCTNSSPANSVRNGCHGVSEMDEDDGGLHGTRFMEVHACSKNLLTLAVRANTLFITEPWQAGNNGPMKHCQYALPSGGEASVAVFHPYRPLLAIGGWGGSRMALYGRQQVC